MKAYILAHDLGTTGDKACLYTTDGELVGTYTARYATAHGRNAWSEQDPEDWWRAFCESSRALTEKIDRSAVLCVAFDGTYPNCLCVDREGKPLRPAMIWQDTRASEEARLISARLPGRYTAGYPGRVMPTDRTLPRLIWLKRHEPDILERTWKLLPGSVGYIHLKLTGRAVCDPYVARSTAMTDPDTGRWSQEICEIAGIPMSILPEIGERTDIVGVVPAELAQACGIPAGTKLVMGTGDAVCMPIGAGMLRPGDAYLNGGTSAEVAAITPEGKKIGRPTAASGTAFQWMADNLCAPERLLAGQQGRSIFEVINETIARSPAGAHGVMFHPYLAGRRATRENPKARGSFIGIGVSNTREDMVRAVVEGIGFDLNLILKDIRRQGVDPKRIPFVGGMGKSPAVRQIFADLMGVELITFEHMDEAASAGAAVLGGMALGLWPDETAVSRFMRPAGIVYPDAANHERYLRLAERYDAVYEAQLPVYELL